MAWDNTCKWGNTWGGIDNGDTDDSTWGGSGPPAMPYGGYTEPPKIPQKSTNIVPPTAPPFDPNDRNDYVNSERIDKFIEKHSDPKEYGNPTCFLSKAEVDRSMKTQGAERVIERKKIYYETQQSLKEKYK